ncbi:MAG: prolipoprotein diacylglyceryl transferase [Gammaproteobacteria bacterium]|nr:prolipoprotein diacylglyceryl transferase [Gammaproteobacteria bacterium]
MLTYPKIDPVAFELGPLAIHWYGLAYVTGIAIGWLLLHRRARAGVIPFTTTEVSDMVFYGAVGGVLGGRLGYVLVYNLHDYLANPLAILKVWEGGMSFHGGVIGFIIATALYARMVKRPFLSITDALVPIVPVGLLLGRIANFIKPELWGAPSNVPWAMVFPDARAGAVPRHPSQLYEAFLEGIVLFIVLWILSRRPRATGLLSGLFLILYGAFRFIVEFVREPDAQIGYLFGGWVTMGQMLSLPMIVAGLLILLFVTLRSRPEDH